jgi:hypothetical protein
MIDCLFLLYQELVMNSKWWQLPAALLCGLLGGMIGSWLMPHAQNSATFETVRVTKDLVIAPNLIAEKGCRISADGTVTATGGLVANQIRGNLIVGRSLLASVNATQQTLENQLISVEIGAHEDRGGEIVLHNRDAAFCPSKGPAKKGFATYLGFDKGNQAPAIFTQDIAQGPQGRAFVVCAKPKPADKAEQETASQVNQQRPARQPVR